MYCYSLFSQKCYITLLQAQAYIQSLYYMLVNCNYVTPVKCGWLQNFVLKLYRRLTFVFQSQSKLKYQIFTGTTIILLIHRKASLGVTYITNQSHIPSCLPIYVLSLIHIQMCIRDRFVIQAYYNRFTLKVNAQARIQVDTRECETNL